MSLHYDEKGKFFTDYVSKNAIRAIVQTALHRIVGQIYARSGERLSDELNRSEQFLAITEAQVYTVDGQHIYDSDFIVLNRDQVVWLMPVDSSTEIEAEDAA